MPSVITEPTVWRVTTRSICSRLVTGWPLIEMTVILRTQARPIGRICGIQAADVGAGEVEVIAFRNRRCDREVFDVADPAVGDDAVLDQRVHDAGRRWTESRSRSQVTAGLRVDHRVDTDQFASRVDQRAAGVAGLIAASVWMKS